MFESVKRFFIPYSQQEWNNLTLFEKRMVKADAKMITLGFMAAMFVISLTVSSLSWFQFPLVQFIASLYVLFCLIVFLVIIPVIWLIRSINILRLK